MAYQVTVLNVMIASPSDVMEERQLVRDAIYEWNAIHSKQLNVILNPVGWENNIAPQMGSHPQEIINKKILEDSDILIGIFWTRLGSPTGEYASGTVEEISKHCAENKLASIYISKKPYPDDINLQQLQLLRDQTNIWLKEGLLEFYDNHSSFKQKIKDHLSLHIQQNDSIKSLLNKQKVISDHHRKDTQKVPHLTSDMKKIILNAGNTDGYIEFNKNMDCTFLTAGELDLELKTPREITYWEETLIELKNLNLIYSENKFDTFFKLTSKAWEVFDQLNAQPEENIKS